MQPSRGCYYRYVSLLHLLVNVAVKEVEALINQLSLSDAKKKEH